MYFITIKSMGVRVGKIASVTDLRFNAVAEVVNVRYGLEKISNISSLESFAYLSSLMRRVRLWLATLLLVLYTGCLRPRRPCPIL